MLHPDWFERTANQLIAAKANEPLDAHQRTTYGATSVSASPESGSPDGLSWSDAALGVIIGIGLATLGGAAAHSIRLRRRVVVS